MKLEKEFQFKDVYKSLDKRRCWGYCIDCKVKWSRTEPPMKPETPIFYYLTEDKLMLNRNEAVGRRFVCESCHQERINKLDKR